VTLIRVWVSIIFVAGVLPADFCAPLFAQETTTRPPVEGVTQLSKGNVEVGGVVGTSLPVTLLRARANRRLTLGTFQVGRAITNHSGRGPMAGSFELLLELAPVVLIEQPQRALGLAVSPLHMRWNFAPIRSGRLGFFAEASGGLIYTNDPVPARATSFNFIDQAGFGIRLRRRRAGQWLLGYRFQHVSNGGRVRPNPGANFNFVYAGVSFRR
jgi:hypothetical protein